MEWPERAVETIPPDQFRPPFCPHTDCRAHHGDGFRFHRHGVFIRKCDRRVVPRFRCLQCGRTCSQQTFAATYFLKRGELLEPIAAGLQAGSAHRQLARSLGCAPSTVMGQAARLGRHALLLLALALARLPRLDEAVVYDDFETFAFSQERPFGMGTAVGSKSWYVYALECAPHRRSGRRSPTQQARAERKQAEPEPSGGYRDAFQRTLDLLLGKRPADQPLELISDDHPGYRAGLGRHPDRRRVRHRVYPNPKREHKGAPRSREAIVRDRALFPVDLLHKLMRHSLAHHRRETIAFGRRHNALMERGFLMAAWRNFVKGRSERKPDPTTPAMVLGLTDRPWGWARLLARRLIPSHVAAPSRWMEIYRRELTTLEVGNNHRHRAVYAF